MQVSSSRRIIKSRKQLLNFVVRFSAITVEGIRTKSFPNPRSSNFGSYVFNDFCDRYAITSNHNLFIPFGGNNKRG